MKPRAMFPAVFLVVLLSLPQLAGAVTVHNLDCKNCHIPALSITALGSGNVCLECHDEPGAVDVTGGTTNSAFLGQDASNAMGHNTLYNAALLRETSHNWSASDNQLTAAGAAPPSRTTYPQFYSRYGSSNGRVTCSRCHNPHATDENPQMLVLGAGKTETMCIACHAPWNKNNAVVNNTFITHPVDVTYNPAQAYYNTTSPPANNGDINIANGISLYGGKVVCGTCHQVHFADSNPATADTPGNWGGLSKADGKILRSYGRVVGDAAKTSTLCKTCHEYDTHGGSHSTLGCLDCHGGHSPSGNYNMLRPQVKSLAWVPKDQAAGDSDALPYTTLNAPWKNSGTGYCEGCHTIPLTVAQHNVATAGMNECKGCHNHQTDSFTSACNACHGYAPSTNTAGGSTGYAVASPTNYYNTAVFKDESKTPHNRHANGSGNYTFDCKQCHYTVTDVNAAPHKNGDFQNVHFSYNSASLVLAWADSSFPSYNPAGAAAAGTCTSVYCHSNGGPRSGGSMQYPATPPVWKDGSIAPNKITTCDACHGNSAATMDGTARDNSATHLKHLTKGYGCNVCHDSTATSDTAVDIPGGKHVNGTVEVSYDNGYSLGVGTLGAGSYGDNGTCGIYCHSNGTTQVTPDWDTASTGACGTCHKYNANADATQDGAGPALGGAHDIHAFAADGPKLACTICHTNNGTGTDHVNGAKSYVANMQTTVCNPCHGATAGVTTGNDREPIWSSVASVDCATCHVGVVAQIDYDGAGGNPARTAPAKNSFFTLGHGDPALNSSPNCLGCHTLTADHIDGVTDSNMLTGALTGDAYCKSCHAINSHYANTKTSGGTSNDGLACATCHEPHGEGMGTNTDVMLLGTIASRTVNNFTDKAARASYWEADNTGVCQICHDPSEVNYFNRTASGVTADTNHNPGSVCTQCHRHNSTPEAFAAGCTDCHGNTATGNYWPDSTAQHGTAWPNRLGSHDIHITKIAGTGATMAQKNATCGSCHPGGGHSGDQAAAPADLMNGTTSKFKDILGAANVQNSVVTQDGGSNVSCSNVDCHYKTATAAADWYTAGSQANCSYCHTVADSPYAAGTLPDAHNQHMNETAAGGRNLVCTDCHASAGTDNAHQNGVINFTTALAPLETTVTMSSAVTAGTIAGPKYGLSAVTTQFSSCATLYCHSTGQTTWTSVSANWASTTVDCTSCHKGVATDTTLTGAHKAHTFSGVATIGRNLTCNECHSATAGGNSTISDASKHVDKTRDILVPNFGTPQAGCATVRCHSNGNYDGTAGSTFVYNNPAWGASYGCDSCHGDGAGKAYPTYANVGTGVNANSHEAHIVGGGYTCNDCHSTTSTAGATINGTDPLQHVDNSIDVAGAKITSFAGGTCNTVSCHGGNSPVWGASLGCRDCHGNATTDTDDFSYNNGTFAKVALDEWTYSGHGKLATAQYEVTLRNGADLDTKAGAGQDACLYCHDGSVSHGNANLFRLRSNGFTYSAAPDLNGACRACHETGTTSFDPDGAGGLIAVDVTAVVKIDKFHGGAKHGTDNDGGRWCWDCHDPHGDADAASQRIQMIQRNPQVNPNAMSVPASLSTTDVIFYNSAIGAGVGGFAMNTLSGAETYAQGICNNCHTNTAQYQGDGTGTQGAGSHPTSSCMTCHPHSGDTTYNGEAFKGSGCNGCHGDATIKNYWPDNDGSVAMPTANNDPAGRHLKHMTVLAAKVYDQTIAQLLADASTDAKQRALCEYCHAAVPTDKDHGVAANVPAEVFSTTMSDDSTVRFAKHLNAAADADAAYNVGADTCSNVDCHNSKLTTDTAFGWYDAGTSTCTMCHTTGGTGANPASGLHAVTSAIQHSDTGLSGAGCGYCHVPPAYSTTSTHINGSFTADSNANTVAERFLITSALITWAEGSPSTCTSTCHADKGNWQRQWSTNADVTDGAVGSARCNVCHGQAGNWRSGLTVDHNLAGINSTGNHTSCEYCHYASANYLADGKHLNQTGTIPNQRYTVTYNSNVGYSTATGSCTNACHSTAKNMGRSNVATVFYDEGFAGSSVSCNSCHYDVGGCATVKTMSGYTFVADANGNLAHTKHVATAATDYTTGVANNTVANYDYTCANCHGNTGTNHMNGSLNISLAGPGWNSTNKTCNNNSCHQDGLGGNAIVTADWNLAGGWVSDPTTDKCDNCHGNSPTSAAHQVHVIGIHSTDIYSGTTGLLTTATAIKSHGDPTNSTTINCNICHNSVVTSTANDKSSSCSTLNCHDSAPRLKGDAAIADKSKHVDGNKQVVFASMATFKSKAQLRDSLADAPTVAASWTRTNNYKAQAAPYSYDAAKNAVPAWSGTGTKTCSTVDCHNGVQATWQVPQNNCMACHTQLPK